MSNRPKSGISKLIVLPAIFAAILLLVSPLGSLQYSWTGWKPATCMPAGCFCEASRATLIRQPANTYSNLGYMLVGLLILGGWRPGTFAGFGTPNLLLNRRTYLTLFGLAVFSIGAGSFFYHASLTFIGQWFDLMGMYLFATFVALYNLSRFRRLPDWVFVLVYVTLNVVLGIVLAVAPTIRLSIFGVLLGLAIGIDVAVLAVRRPRIQPRYFFAALACFAVAYLIWTLDQRRILCAPGSLLQGHAAWHLLTALSTVFVFRYYLSDESGPA